MTYQEDPNDPRRDVNTAMNRDASREAGYGSWVIGGLVALAVIAGIFAFFGRDDSNTSTASNPPDRPAAGAPATTPSPSPGTTGSGSTSPPPAAR
jgi:hypothetical protein